MSLFYIIFKQLIESRINFRGGETPSAPPTGNQGSKAPLAPRSVAPTVEQPTVAPRVFARPEGGRICAIPRTPPFCGTNYCFPGPLLYFYLMHSYARSARPYCYCPLRGSKTYYKATYGLFVIRKKQSGKSPIKRRDHKGTLVPLDGVQGERSSPYLLSSVFQLVSQVVHIYKYFILSSSYLR